MQHHFVLLVSFSAGHGIKFVASLEALLDTLLYLLIDCQFVSSFLKNQDMPVTCSQLLIHISICAAPIVAISRDVASGILLAADRSILAAWVQVLMHC